nr:MAG TPA: hypothetical protein [Caudoviricetes sp.]
MRVSQSSCSTLPYHLIRTLLLLFSIFDSR